MAPHPLTALKQQPVTIGVQTQASLSTGEDREERGILTKHTDTWMTFLCMGRIGRGEGYLPDTHGWLLSPHT